MDFFELLLALVSLVLAIWGVGSNVREASKRLWIAVSIAPVILVTAYITYLNSEVALLQAKQKEIYELRKQAADLIKHRRTEFSDEGFTQAALAFLEQNKAYFPDTYKRAQGMCEEAQCYSPRSQADNSLHHAWDQGSLASAYEGILRGLSIVHAAGELGD